MAAVTRYRCKDCKREVPAAMVHAIGDTLQHVAGGDPWDSAYARTHYYCGPVHELTDDEPTPASGT